MEIWKGVLMDLFDKLKNLSSSQKGYRLLKQGKYEEAIKYLDKALELDPKNAKALYSKGLLLGKNKKYQESIKCFDKILEINSNNDEAWFSKGLGLLSLKKYEEALECYNQALELDSNHIMAWNNKVYALEILGKDEPLATATKMKVADQSIFHDPEHPSALILPIIDL